ncbi:nucleosome assembly protein 1-like 1-A [Teleopsis dalmanni]|uniref:nucleosome assembly protein 1-like 1-A n=1 Tax=Teleopsis dalmanni TaxID=139649 RepID=UPI0018CC9300|nr:nucleosome assembly protein 1-like 1-A [Teleopsis dalmanni]
MADENVDLNVENFPKINVAPAYMCAGKRREFLHNKVKKLPRSVKDKIIVLKNMQLDYIQLEEQYFQQLYTLQSEFQDRFQQLNDQRQSIVMGTTEPPAEEPNYNAVPLEVGPDALTEQDCAQVQSFYDDIEENCKGIPNFWLTILRNIKAFAVLIHERDEPALKKLVDIKAKFDKLDSFTLEFYFKRNRYFSNTLLTRQYFLRTTAEDDKPFHFDGLEIYKTHGCVIDWYPNMELTEGFNSTFTSDFQTWTFESFFEFFYIPDARLDDEKNKKLRDMDFELAYLLRNKVIPRAVLYYTGDIVDDENDKKEISELYFSFDDDIESEGSVEIIGNDDIDEYVNPSTNAY